MLNSIIIMGRMTRDPELRRTGNGTAVTSFTIAVDRNFTQKGSEKDTDFIDCVAWRNTAEYVDKYFSKGSMAVVSGRLQIRSYQDKDGRARRAAEVVADQVYFGDRKRDTAQTSVSVPGPESFGYVSNGYSGLMELPDDEQLPY